MFFAGDDIVPVWLSIPDWNLEDIASSIPLDTKANTEPVVWISKAPVHSKASKGSYDEIGDGIVKIFDAPKETSCLNVLQASRFNGIQATK